MINKLWITWNIQRRNVSLSSAIGATLEELISTASNWVRYPLLATKTIKLIVNQRPDQIYAQNPSLVLAFLVSIVGKILKTPVIIDLHNAGLFPMEGKSKVLNRIALEVNALADIVIVTNEELRRCLINRNVRSVVMPDPIPDFGDTDSYNMDIDKFNVVYICSWASDEPNANVIEAAKILGKEFRIYITGKPKLSGMDINASEMSNIILTGYLSNNEYESLLSSADAIMVLTTRDDCLVCGAYEGVSVEKPLVISDTKALREYFCSGCEYTDNSASDIAASILQVKKNYSSLKKDISVLKQMKIPELENSIQNLNSQLESLR